MSGKPQTCEMRINSVYEYVEEKIGGAFERFGRFISRHAWKVIIIAIIINGGLGVGMLKLKSNIDTENVYLPQGSQARKDLEKVEAIFPDLSGSNFNSLQLSRMGSWARLIIKSTSGNMLTRAQLEEVEALDTIIQALTATADDGSTITYSSICARAAGSCSVDGEMFWSTEFLAAIDANQVTYPLFTYSAGTTDYASDIGGEITTSGSYLTGMEYINLDYLIRTDGDQYTENAKKWVEVFKVRMEEYTSPNLEIAYGHFKSLDEEIDQNISGDISLFSVTFTLMITYACVATLSSRITDQVGQRMWLGFAGTFAAGFAVVAAFGLCAAAGLDFVSIVGVVPFLIIGIGIDDMFILLSGLNGAQGEKTVEDKIGKTMRYSGVGITITSLTDLIAFMAGAGSSFIAVRNFCVYTGVAVIFCYINNVTFFTACMTINERRVAGNRHYGTCRPIKTKEQLREEGRTGCFVTCCGGRPPTNREEAESWIDKLPRWLLPKIVLKTPLKIVIVLLFMGYLAAAIFGCVNLRQGLKFTELVSDNSYFYKFSKWDEDYFGRTSPVSFVIDSTYTYSDSNTYSLVEDLITSAQSNDYFDSSFEVNWLKTYRTTAYYDASSEANFIAGFKTFIAQPQYAFFENDIKTNAADTIITASRVYVLTNNLADSQEEGKMMLKSREIAKAAEIECFAFSAYFVAFEQYVAILGQTLQSVGIALAAVFVITCIFMPHPVLIVFTTLAVTMIMVGVFGFLHYLDLALSSITMVHLIMSIGFSIDFTAHICHGYMISDGKSRDIRVKQAIDKTGAPIFHGAVSSILGIIVLVAAKSYIFRTFSAVMALVLVFGIAHALLLLPVILSWMGPGRLNKNTDEEETAKENQVNNESEKPQNGNGHLNGGLASKEQNNCANNIEMKTNDTNGVKDKTDFEQKAKKFNLEADSSDNHYSWTEAKE